MFTDKFIPFPVKEFSDKEKELTGNENCRDTTEKIDPFQIASYRDSIDNEGLSCVTITYKSGSAIAIYLTFEEFEKRLNEHK